MLSGKVIFQSPLNYGYDMFLSQLQGVNSIDGGINLGCDQGLISYEMWKGCYGFHVLNLHRKSEEDDAVEKVIQLSWTSAAKVPLNFSVYIQYSRSWSCDTVSGKIIV
jgi:hypothetical protein